MDWVFHRVPAASSKRQGLDCDLSTAEASMSFAEPLYRMCPVVLDAWGLAFISSPTVAPPLAWRLRNHGRLAGWLMICLLHAFTRPSLLPRRELLGAKSCPFEGSIIVDTFWAAVCSSTCSLREAVLDLAAAAVIPDGKLRRPWGAVCAAVAAFRKVCKH